MSEFSTSIGINAPSDRVWAALADIGNIYLWNPGVRASHLTSDEKLGVDTSRFCDLGRGNYLDEMVVKWDAGKALTMRVTGTNLPFKAVDIRFTLEPNGDSTIVTVSPQYTLKFGLLGKIFDRVYVQRSYRNGMENLLAGLKEFVEA
jgi:uncharacterized protein YndB with AHSA1/START domain